MQKKEITYCERYSKFNNLLRSQNNMKLTVFAPDTQDPSFKIGDYATFIGKNDEEIIQYINRYDEANHYNRIYTYANSIKVPEDIFVLLTTNDNFYIIKCIIRNISFCPYRTNQNFKYEAIYETGEIYEIFPFESKKIANSNYYEIRDNLTKFVHVGGTIS